MPTCSRFRPTCTAISWLSRPAKPSKTIVARCTTLDVGHLVVPFPSSSPLVEEGQVSVHRLHRESFKAKGIEPGEIRFDVAHVVTFKR